MLIGEKKKENMVNMHLKIQKELNELKFTRINAKDSALSSGKEDKTGGKPQTGRKMSNRANSLDEYSFIGKGFFSLYHTSTLRVFSLAIGLDIVYEKL